MQEIIEILMNRDGLTKAEARDEYMYVRQEINNLLCEDDPDAIEDFLAEELGLEPDYIFNFI